MERDAAWMLETVNLENHEFDSWADVEIEESDEREFWYVFYYTLLVELVNDAEAQLERIARRVRC